MVISAVTYQNWNRDVQSAFYNIIRDNIDSEEVKYITDRIPVELEKGLKNVPFIIINEAIRRETRPRGDNAVKIVDFEIHVDVVTDNATRDKYNNQRGATELRKLLDLVAYVIDQNLASFETYNLSNIKITDEIHLTPVKNEHGVRKYESQLRFIGRWIGS